MPQKDKAMETLRTAVRTEPANNFATMVERLYAGEASALKQGTLVSVIAVHFISMGAANDGKRNTFRRLLLQMNSRRCYAVLRNPGFINVLANMSTFGTKMVRPVEDWVKDSLTAEGQLASLIRHCFAKFDVPEFMEHVFAEGNIIHMFWYIQLGRGESVQKLSGFPIAFTKKMAHEFRETPSQYTVVQAIRRAQALGFGARACTAEAIAWADTIEQLPEAAFREAVIRFVAGVDGTVAFDQLQQTVEYLTAMYRENASFSLKGRTWASLTRDAARYHAELAKKRAAECFSDWERSAVKDYEIERESVIFRIVQLDTSEALYEEGAEMSHCVAEYAYDCAEGSCAIFSLRKFATGDTFFERLATIEVRLETAEIVQAKARYNEDISDEAHEIIFDWAKREKLTADYGFYDPADDIAHPVPQPAPYQLQRQVVDYERRLAQRGAFRNESGIDGADIVKIILAILKIIWILSRF